MYKIIDILFLQNFFKKKKWVFFDVQQRKYVTQLIVFGIAGKKNEFYTKFEPGIISTNVSD
jgi:hypothetical protein